MFLYKIADPISNRCKIANDRVDYCSGWLIKVAEDENSKNKYTKKNNYGNISFDGTWHQNRLITFVSDVKR